MKAEFKFENDINYYFYTLSSSTPINYLFKYNKDLKPKIYYAGINNGEDDKSLNLKEINYTTKDDSNFSYSYAKIEFGSYSKLYLIFYNNDNRTFIGNQINISINEHDLSSYDQINIYSSETINLIKDKEKIIAIGDLENNEKFYIKIIHPNSENLTITSNLFNKSKSEIYEINSEKVFLYLLN